MSDLTNTRTATARPRPSVGLWIKTARPFSLAATASPLLVGTAVAAYHGVFHPAIFAAALIAGLALQIGANYFNEFFDWKYGLDSAQSLGASTVIFQGTMTANHVLAGGIVAFIVAALLGGVIVVAVGPAMLLFGLAGMAIAYFYSARPFKLATRGLGDVFVFVAMGVLMTWGAYYVQIPRWSWSAFAASIPIGLLVTAILNMNNIRDREDDLAVQKRTVVVRFGRRFGKGYQAALIIGAYVILTVFALTHLLPLFTLLAWLSFPTAYTHLRAILPAADRKVYMRGMQQIAALHLQFGVAMAAGIFVAALAHVTW